MTPGVPGPTPPSQPAIPTPAPLPEAVDFPLGWLLSNAPSPLQYRATVEIARLQIGQGTRLSFLPYSYRPALALAMTQAADGTWGGAMLTVPGPRARGFQGVGTINAVRRLLEYGWERESPPLLHARRILFRLLAEDDDPAYLFELAPRGRGPFPPEVVAHGRGILREAAAAALSQAGYESDPRLRGAARRITERLDAYLRSPLAQKPFVRAGNQHVLAPGAAPPSIFALHMLAFMPTFCSEHYDVMERLYAHLVQPQPRPEPAQLVAQKLVEQPHLVMGDPLPHRTAADADLPATLYWLELIARLGLLRRNENWSRLFDRLLDDRDASGVWHVPRRSVALRSTNPFVWPSFPLDPDGTPAGVAAEVTFRLGLIARYAGRPIEVI